MRIFISCLTLFFICSPFVSAQLKNAIQGTKCARNQVVNKLVVYEDGAIEAECGPIPCGNSGERCIEDQSACKAETDIFSGMKWAKNGQSLLLRCCSMTVPNKVYIGTDLVTLGSYYTGGLVSQSEKYVKESSGPEYDFVVNVRTEQGGVRVWVYRIICPSSHESIEQKQIAPVQNPSPVQQQSSSTKTEQFERRRQHLLKQIAESQDQPSESVTSGQESSNTEAEGVVNPLQYRPTQYRQRQKDAPEPVRLL
ncbi:WRT-10 protein [Ditylenchus destructor]|uniref:WRT-10 protein n=1 Tax=Ditylenchus destructor TaxID=166010 RepID=A0AAD4NGX6_9BILA|nr:WRT-10 protein [Ditylenchus destructor]